MASFDWPWRGSDVRTSAQIGCLSTHVDEGYACGRIGSVVPQVVRAALDDDVPGPEQHLPALEHDVDLAGQNQTVVYRVGPVHLAATTRRHLHNADLGGVGTEPGRDGASCLLIRKCRCRRRNGRPYFDDRSGILARPDGNR